MHFEGHLASDPEDICDLFAEFIQRTYTEDVWMLSDPGPEHVPDDPPFDALQFTSNEVESVLQDLDVNKGSGSDGKLLLNEMSVGIEPARCMWAGILSVWENPKIRIGDAVSRDIKVTSGVPQGSHLGPLCFNRISEIFDYLGALFYAEDTKLFLPVSGFQDCLKIQSDLNKLLEWCDWNSLLLNVVSVSVTP
jgi:hypothetical protein